MLMYNIHAPDMSIPPTYQRRSVYHFTPIANLSTILAHGLLSIAEQKRLGLPLRTIVWKAIQTYRTGLAVPVGPGGFAHEYVPFYFCKLSPMLLSVISNKVVDEETIIHFEFPIDILEQYPAVFTDAAVIPGSEAHFYSRSADLDHLNWDAIDSPAWRMPNLALRHARLAELLIHRQMPISAATRIIVWDNDAVRQVAEMYAALQQEPPCIETDPGCYFIDPAAPHPTPVVRGPKSIYQVFRETVERLRPALGHAVAPRFSDLEALRLALQRDFGCLPETDDLVGLETDNRAHFEDVGAHTRRVVAELLKTPEYRGLPAPDQALVEVAAFLHDIGKGPKQRWANSGGKQQIDFDHPVKALPMLERILTEEVAQVSLEEADLLCKLVAYHDIIGGVLSSGRRLEELQAITNGECELDMFLALSRADASAINPAWIDPAQRAALRQAALQRGKED
jgi:hypothetical protein